MKKMLLGLGTLAILSGCASNPLDNPTSQSCAKYYKTGEIPTAKAVCTKISNSGDADGYFYLASIERDKGNGLASLELLYRARSAYSSEYQQAEKMYLDKALLKKKNKEYDQAKIIFESLASLNNVRAQRELGILHYYGLGIDADPLVALSWFKKGAEAGDQFSKNATRNIAQEIYEKGLALYKAKKYVEALDVWLPIAKEGHYDAQGYLGDLYRLGKLGNPDYFEAAEWYKLAADQGGAYEAYQYALLLEEGNGIALNKSEAFKYFKKAAEKGHSAAYFSVAHYLHEGEFVNQNLTTAREWYEKSLADKPTPSAQNNLALMFWYGLGGERDLDKARELFQLASESGSSLATKNLKNLDDKLIVQRKHPNSPELFGINLYGANRQEIRTAIKSAGAKPLRETYNYYADKYNSKDIMPGSSKMLVFYSLASDLNEYGGPNDYLAEIRYEFPTSDKRFVDEIKGALSQKYGDPDQSHGTSRLGTLVHYWYKDGVTIKLRRGWPSLDVFLYYKVSDFERKMDAEIEAEKKAKKMKKYQEADSAF